MKAVQSRLGQYFTPQWVAEAIVEEHLSALMAGDTVIEPSCGDGSFLRALPSHLHGLGVEIDGSWAEVARASTSHQVITGNFLEVDLPNEAAAVIGNPPFAHKTVAAFLDRAHGLLRDGGFAVFILPAYILQTSSKVEMMQAKWTISQSLLPRNIFRSLRLPLTLTKLVKERQRGRLFGFFLYEETASVAGLDTSSKAVLQGSASAAGAKPGGSVWRLAVHHAFDRVGSDQAHVGALYKALEGRRPTANPHHREKVRQVLGRYPEFLPVESGVWRRNALQ